MVQKAGEENRKPRVEDFGNQVSDSTFLNQLQKDVSRWIKEIKKVLKFCSIMGNFFIYVYIQTFILYRLNIMYCVTRVIIVFFLI